MVAIVVLTLTYISVLSDMFAGQADEVAVEASGGFEVVVQSNPSNPVPVDDLAAVEGVDLVAPIGYAGADFVSGDDDLVTWPVSGFGEELLAGRPPALDDVGRYDSEQAAWRAVLDDPGLIIVDEFFLVTDAGPPTDTIDVGDNLTMSDPLSGESRKRAVPVDTVLSLSPG